MAISMMNDSDNPELDNEMANLTDALLAGRSIKSSDAARPLEPVVRGLQQLATPAQPSADFRSRLSQRLSTEFDSQSRTRRTNSFSSSIRRYRPLLTAAALIILIGAALLVTNQVVLTGTAGGDLSSGTGIVLAFFVVVLVAVGVFFWWRERK